MNINNQKKMLPLRMDFIQEISTYRNQQDGSIKTIAIIKPDPQKYSYIEVEGKGAFKDRFSGAIILEDTLIKSIRRMPEVPIYFTPPKQTNYSLYLKERKAELLKNWEDKYVLTDKLTDTQETFYQLLKKLRGKDSQLVILYVDMAGSTKISSELDSETNQKIIKIFLMQMARVIDNFRGYVFKFVGDCVIGIFPADINFTSMCDNTIQAAMIMRSVIEYVINPVFIEKGLPQIGCHIGLDIGSVRIDRVGALNVAAFDDLIGYPMNLTAKIQSRAGYNEILLGKNLFSLLHCNWQEQCEKKDLGSTWTMKDPSGETTYIIYRFCSCQQGHTLNNN